MSAAVASTPPGSSGPAAGSAWLFGPAIDIAVGCGGLYLLLFSFMAGGAFGISDAQHDLLRPLLILLFSLPHYGATLLRVYERSEDRARYRLFGLWGAVLVYGTYAAGLNFPIVGAWFLTVYLTWSPWHYTGQNFGIAMTFLRRAGVTLDPRSRRFLQVSFTLSFLVVMLTSHGSFGQQADYALVNRYAGGFAFISLGFPAWFTAAAVPACLAGIVVCLIGAGFGLRGQASVRECIPAIMIVLLQTIWFTVPFSLGHFGISTGIPFIDLVTRDTLFTYIAIAHACQYLWITTYFARRSTTWSNYGMYWAKAIAFGHAAILIPTLLAVKTPLSSLSYDAGVAVLAIAALNLHHFILDGAIWKLRSGRIANILLRSGKDEETETKPAPVWRRPLVLAAVAVFLAAALFQTTARVAGVEAGLRDGSPESASRALDRLSWFAEESGADRLRIGESFAAAKQPAQAAREFERSLALRETPPGWARLAEARESLGDPQGALDAYDAALALEPLWVTAIEGGGLVAHRAGMHEEAVRRLRPLFSAGWENPEVRDAYLESRRALNADKAER